MKRITARHPNGEAYIKICPTYSDIDTLSTHYDKPDDAMYHDSLLSMARRVPEKILEEDT